MAGFGYALAISKIQQRTNEDCIAVLTNDAEEFATLEVTNTIARIVQVFLRICLKTSHQLVITGAEGYMVVLKQWLELQVTTSHVVFRSKP